MRKYICGELPSSSVKYLYHDFASSQWAGIELSGVGASFQALSSAFYDGPLSITKPKDDEVLEVFPSERGAGAVLCVPEEFKGPHLEMLFIGLQVVWL